METWAAVVICIIFCTVFSVGQIVMYILMSRYYTQAKDRDVSIAFELWALYINGVNGAIARLQAGPPSDSNPFNK